MPVPFSETLREWQSFYFMAGGSAATLIGLLFVAISLGSHLVSPERKDDIDTYVTPILFYFISVLILAFIMLVPAASTSVPGALLTLAGAAGLIRVAGVVRQMVEAAQRVPIEHGHWTWHAVLPCVSYALALGTGLWLVVSGTSASLAGLAPAIVLLLISGIWRSWDLVLWIAHQRVR
jgi:hypothetical protein